MRAKRSKKYRKTMSAYQQAFSFRPPYQVLLDSNFLRTAHSFHMPLQKYLDNTLHDPCRLFVTQCTLDKVTKWHEKDKQRRGDKRLGGRPEWLPPPTEVPLRYCKHKDAEGNEVSAGEWGEERCLLDLVSGQVKGNEVVKNKQHFVVATADRVEEEPQRHHQQQQGKSGRRPGGVELRERIRQVPGVPIVYVKRSVMILEELSPASEAVRRQGEREKIKEGLNLGNDRKRKRGEEDGEEGGNEILRELMRDEEVQVPTARGMARARGPNPLSVKQKKVKMDQTTTTGAGEEGKKKSTRRMRGKKKKPVAAGEPGGTGHLSVTAVDTSD